MRWKTYPKNQPKFHPKWSKIQQKMRSKMQNFKAFLDAFLIEKCFKIDAKMTPNWQPRGGPTNQLFAHLTLLGTPWRPKGPQAAPEEALIPTRHHPKTKKVTKWTSNPTKIIEKLQKKTQKENRENGKLKHDGCRKKQKRIGHGGGAAAGDWISLFRVSTSHTT